MNGLVIIVLTVVVAILTAIVTLIWWKVGDQWADEEYKKFGHGGGAPKGPPPTVIEDFDSEPSTKGEE
jgi:hypothetical protein